MPRSPTAPDPRAAEALARRLRRLGLTGVRAVRLHRNRVTMASLTADRVLRLHLGYAHAPDSVLAAIVAWARPRVPRSERARLERRILAFPARAHAPVPDRPAAGDPADRPLVRRLERLHARLNERHFGGRLGWVPFRVSRRMRSMLGELTLDPDTGRPAEIAISRRHVVHDGWAEVRETVLHEMIHQWQAETGRPVDHGPGFRRKALRLGVEPAASRTVGRAARRTAARRGRRRASAR